LILHIRGASVHASIPKQAINPLQVLSRFVLGLQDLKMKEDDELGKGTIATTLLRTDQTSPNVTPGEVWLTCDCRTIPTESGAEVREKLQLLADDCLIEGASARVQPSVGVQITYTGMKEEIPAEHPAFLVSVDHPAVISALEILKNAINLEKNADVWQFATDGGHFAQAGQTVIGFGPGGDHLAHTIEESISVVQLEKAIVGNRSLALKWPASNQ
jgi:acetylornithine deacetylase/succinyl-diaminopimelate desuccinylase-like protein